MALHLAWAVFQPQNLLQTINPTVAFGSTQTLPSSLDMTKLLGGACRRQAHGDAGRRIRRACTITRRSEIASTGAALSIEASTLTPSPRFTSIISWIAEKNRTVLVCHRTSKAGNTSPLYRCGLSTAAAYQLLALSDGRPCRPAFTTGMVEPAARLSGQPEQRDWTELHKCGDRELRDGCEPQPTVDTACTFMSSRTS